MCRLRQEIMTQFDPKFEVPSGRKTACNTGFALGGVLEQICKFAFLL